MEVVRRSRTQAEIPAAFLVAHLLRKVLAEVPEPEHAASASDPINMFGQFGCMKIRNEQYERVHKPETY